MFGSQEHWRAVVRAEEADAFFGDLGEFQEAHHLETFQPKKIKRK